MKMSKLNLQRWIASVMMTLPVAGNADVQPAALFADGMVIQRETKAPVWGTADAGEQVTVTASWGGTADVTAGENGKWSVKLQTPSAGGPHTLTIKGNNSVEIKNVLSGEVWFCSGQSNMDFTMKKLSVVFPQRTTPEHIPAANYVKQEMETATDALLRQFTVPKTTSPLEPRTALAGSWMDSSPQNNPGFSATAYFFGRELREKLNVPVGLIHCAWGGTRIEAWIPTEGFQQDKEMAAYVESNKAELESKMATWSPEQAKADYQASLMSWKDKGAGRTVKRGSRPKKASDPKTNPQLPSTLFNGMVNPVIPYAIKGVIWYQGESNAGHNPHKYETNFRAMINSWRDHWGQGDVPFYFAQLANYRGRSRANYRPPAVEPVEYHGWPSICDQQRRTLGLKNTGMAVLTDIGEAADVHPHNKMDVGKRLALWALKHDYQQKLPVCSGPLYQSHTIKGDAVIITFDSAGSGLMAGSKVGMANAQATDDALTYFQICGADRKWKWAEAELTGKDTIAVSHPDVANPTVVRYAWSENPEGANLYNKEGLPASLFTTEAEIPFEMDAVAPSNAQPVAEPPLSGASLKKGDRIVFLGDSITALGVKEDGYVTLTSQAIATAFPDLGIEVIGAGKSGHKVPDCQKRLDRDVLQKKPTVVVIYIGINDVWHWTLPARGGKGLRKGTTPEQFESGLKDMIETINGVGARVILCTPTVIGEKPDGTNPDDKRLDAYAEISRKVARETDSQLLDLRAAFMDYLNAHNPNNAEKGILTADRVHMNANGNQFLFTLVSEALNVPAP